MRIIRVIVPDNFDLVLFGDCHEGSMMFQENGFKKMADYILSDKNILAVDHSDAIEAITVDDKRFHIETTKRVNIDKQVDAAIDRRFPFRKRLITVLKGNHEHSLIRVTNAAERIANGLGVRYGTFSCVIEYYDSNRNLMFKHYATHGSGKINSTADDPVRANTNKKLILKRKLKNKFGDTLLNSMGHTHKLLVLPPEPMLYLQTENGKIKQHYTAPRKTTGYIEPNHKWYVNTGSLMKLYLDGTDGYAERFMLDPVELGFAVAKIRDKIITGIETIRTI